MEQTLEVELKVRNPFLPYINRKERWACMVVHRRGGKTVACIQDLIKHALECEKKEGRFAYVAPTYRQAKDIAWNYLRSYTAEIPGTKTSESELSVTLHNGARVRLYGADNYEALRGIYLDGAVLDEYGDMDPRAFPEVIRPALSDRLGWASFIGTPKGANEFKRVFDLSQKDPKWYSCLLKASETGLIDPEELADARSMLEPEVFAQEYQCSFSGSVRGAIYARDLNIAEDEGRITSVPYDRAADVFASWDLGIGDATAIWVGQIVGKEYHWLRHYEASGYALDHYVDWIKRLPYDVHQLILPHDAEAREKQTGSSTTDFLRERGFKCKVLPRGDIEDRIAKARIKFPAMWFDKKGCEAGIECLRNYRYDVDEKRGVLRKQPLHDWSSHSADSFGYGVLGAQPARQRTPMPELESGWVV